MKLEIGKALKSFSNSLFNRDIQSVTKSSTDDISNAFYISKFESIMSGAWGGLNHQKNTCLAQTIDPIDSTITFFAEIFSSGIYKAVDKNGIDVTDTDLLVQLLNKPNEFQNGSEYRKQWLYYHYANGWNYEYPKSESAGFERNLIKNSESTRTKIYNLDPDHIVWKTSMTNVVLNFLGFLKSKSILFSYKPFGFSQIEFSQVIPYFDVRQDSEKPFIGISRLGALHQQIENFRLSVKGKQNLIKRTGVILVSQTKQNEDLGLETRFFKGNDENDIPIQTSHKESLQEDLRNASLGNDSMGVIFSTLSLNPTPLSQGLENVKFDEYSIQDARQIINKFNLPQELANLTPKTSVTAEDRQSAMISVIQNIIQPLANSFCAKKNSFFNHENTISLDFSHLPMFAENENTKILTQTSIVNLYKSLLIDKVITNKEFKDKLQSYGII